MKTALTPSQSAEAYLIRNFGPFLVTMSDASKRQLTKAYIAGLRAGRNGRKRA
jgi:hypothetical protein